MCDEWKNSFSKFREWAINNGYREDLSIDRIDVNGNYEPSNCRWVDAKVQSNNRRNNIIVEYNNERMTLKQWSDLLNLNYKIVHFNYKRGIKLEDIPMTIEKNRINRSVIMCDKDTEKEIKKFNCINEAIKELKLNKNQRSSIYACLNGKQKTGLGYKWKYAEGER